MAEERLSRVVWMPIPGKSDQFFDLAEKTKTEKEFYELLVEAHEKGWVEIFGMTTADPKEILAQVAEESDLRMIGISMRERKED